MKDFIAIDFETANPKRVSACALGYTVVENGEILETNGYLIKPIGGHAPFQTKIHGIKDEHTRDKPDFGELFPEIRALFERPLVAHSQFDKQVLNALAEYFNLKLAFDYTDTSSIAKEKLPDLKDSKLKTLVKHFELPPFKHHDARDDAKACAQILLKLVGDVAQAVADVLDAPTIKIEEEMEFKGLLKGVLADDDVNYKEAYELLYWLEDHPDIQAKEKRIFDKLIEVLDDDILDLKEARMIKDELERVLGE